MQTANQPQIIRHSRFAALRYRDFRIMWLGLLFSNIGSQMQFTGLNWHIFILTKSPLALGFLGLSRFIPITIFSLVSGVVADAHNRKKILLITQAFMTLFSFILAITTLNKTISPHLIYILSALSAVAFAFDTPPRQAIIPRLVDIRHLPNALSLNVIMWQTSLILGPTLAGLMIAKYNIGYIYLINSISFLAVIFALLLMKTSGEVEEKVKVSLTAIIEGLSFVKSKTLIWSTMLLDFIGTFFSSAISLLPIFATEILKVGPVGFGWLTSAPAIGAVIVAFVIAHLGTIKHQGLVLLLAVALYGFATIIFGLSNIFAISFIALFFVGAGDSISAVIRNTIRQLNTPDHIRGRMTSINMIFFMGGPQLGEFEAGLLAAVLGGPLSVAVGGLTTLVFVAAVSLFVPKLRNYP